jgi:hypothetical protein
VHLYERNRSLTLSFNQEFSPHPCEESALQGGQSPSQGVAGLDYKVPSVNSEDDELFSLTINMIYPNWVLETAIGFHFVHEFWPIDAQTTRWETTTYFSEPANATALISQQQSVALLRDTFREDIATSEGSQAGIMSGSLTDINFADSEISCRKLYESVTKLVNGQW